MSGSERGGGGGRRLFGRICARFSKYSEAHDRILYPWSLAVVNGRGRVCSLNTRGAVGVLPVLQPAPRVFRPVRVLSRTPLHYG